MKHKRYIAGVFLLLLTVGLPGLEQKDFDAVVDFSRGMKEIAESVKRPDFSPAAGGKFLIFNGSVATVTILDNAEETFTAELEIVGGEWKGTEEVTAYRAFVYVQGPHFAKRIPEKQPKTPFPGQIRQNDTVLVVGRIEDVYTDDGGNRFPVILASYLRTLKQETGQSN